MPRNKNLAPIILISAVVIGAFAISAYDTSHHANQAKTPAQQTTPNTATESQPNSSQYPGAVVPELDSAKCHDVGVLPDPNCSPGVTSPNVTQANIAQTICVSGFTKTIRPPVSYTDKIKRQQMIDYGFTDSISKHEEDHIISLELGGSPDDPRNLWPEPHASPNAKDKVEDFLHAAVCGGHVSLGEAQQRIATNWTTAEQGLTE